MKFVPKKLEETADISAGADGSPRATLKYVGLVAGVLLGAYVLLGLIADGVVATISEDAEAKLFNWDLGLDSGAGHAGLARAQSALDRLIAGEAVRPLPFRLFLSDTPGPNAFALPGGAVGVTPELLDGVGSELGLAMVLAHELGHHQYRHALQRVGRTILYRGALALTFGDTGGTALEAGLGAAQARYSRGQETEADEFGLRLVHEVYGTTEGALEFFELIAREHEDGESRWTRFADSHPLTEDRLAALRALQAELAER